jgi:hypothetical protein
MNERYGTAAVLQGFVGFFLEDLSRMGQPNRSRKTLEELRLKTFLHGANLSPQRRLRYMASFGSSCKAALLGHGQKVTHLS